MKAGDKVVCIDDSPGAGSHSCHRPNGSPVKGEVYCVTEVFPNGISCSIGFSLKPSIRIAGKPTFIIKTGEEWAYMACRFRPVAEVGHPPIKVERPQELEVRP